MISAAEVAAMYAAPKLSLEEVEQQIVEAAPTKTHCYIDRQLMAEETVESLRQSGFSVELACIGNTSWKISWAAEDRAGTAA